MESRIEETLQFDESVLNVDELSLPSPAEMIRYLSTLGRPLIELDDSYGGDMNDTNQITKKDVDSYGKNKEEKPRINCDYICMWRVVYPHIIN